MKKSVGKICILLVVLSIAAQAQNLKIAGSWRLNPNLSMFNGNPRYIADSTIKISKHKGEIVFERTYYNPKEVVIERLKFGERTSILRGDSVTKYFNISYSKEDNWYLMKVENSYRNNPNSISHSFINKWCLDKDGKLVRWLTSPGAYEVKLVYDLVKE